MSRLKYIPRLCMSSLIVTLFVETHANDNLLRRRRRTVIDYEMDSVHEKASVLETHQISLSIQKTLTHNKLALGDDGGTTDIDYLIDVDDPLSYEETDAARILHSLESNEYTGRLDMRYFTMNELDEAVWRDLAMSMPTSTSAIPDNCSTLSRKDAFSKQLETVTDGNLLNSMASPQSQALDFLVDDDLQVDPCSYSTVVQRYALATIYFSTMGDDWIDNQGWLTDASECNWKGITCASGQVTGLSLAENGLEGSIPHEIRVLTSLRRFEVFRNGLQGTIPDVLDEMACLRLFDVEYNLLTGAPVVNLAGLTDIESYRVSHNQLTGFFVTTIGDVITLKELWMANNTNIAGTIPTEIGRLSNLESLIVYNNQLSGTIPTEIGLLNDLFDLLINDNGLVGTIPTELYSNTDLRFLRLDNNMLTGRVSDLIGQLTDLHDLRIDLNLLTGSLPSSFTDLEDLRVLRVNDNFFDNSIENSFGNLQDLDFVDFSRNSFTGMIPDTIFSTPVRVLYLSSNSLTGMIPSNYGAASNLMDFFIDFNNISGTVPSIQTGQLTNLNEFLLQENLLTGDMPDSICNLQTSNALEDLWADCDGMNPPIACSCCTKCF